MVLLGSCSSLGPLALNVYLPGLPAVQAGFQGDLSSVQATVSLPLLAFGLGLVLLGPIADRHGRRSSLLVGLLAFVVGCVIAALAPTLALLRRPSFLRAMLQVGLLYSAYPAFIAIAPHLMVGAFHRPAAEYSYYYALLPVGYFAGNAFVLRYGRQLGTHRLVLAGSLLGAIAAAASLVMLYRGTWHPLALFLPCGLLLNMGIGFALPSVSAAAVTSAAPNTASGWGLAGFAQQFVAAISVQALALFPDDSPYPVVWLCLGLVAAAFLIEKSTGTPDLPRARAP